MGSTYRCSEIPYLHCTGAFPLSWSQLLFSKHVGIEAQQGIKHIMNIHKKDDIKASDIRQLSPVMSWSSYLLSMDTGNLELVACVHRNPNSVHSLSTTTSHNHFHLKSHWGPILDFIITKVLCVACVFFLRWNVFERQSSRSILLVKGSSHSWPSGFQAQRPIINTCSTWPGLVTLHLTGINEALTGYACKG